jgi:hypothetical protein
LASIIAAPATTNAPANLISRPLEGESIVVNTQSKVDSTYLQHQPPVNNLPKSSTTAHI